MTTIAVHNDPTRPFIIHLRKQDGPVVQVSEERKQAEIDAAIARKRSICIHRLYRFFQQAYAEAICERDNLRFVAIQEVLHAH